MFLNIDKYIEDNELEEITTSNLRIADNVPDPFGLFSNAIFGQPGSAKYRNQLAYIELNCFTIQPKLYDIIDRSFSLLSHILQGKKSILNNEVVDGNAGLWGVSDFKNNFKLFFETLIDRKDISDNAKLLLEVMRKNLKVAFLDKFLVYPPGYRSMRENYMNLEVDDLSQIYIRLINECGIIKTMSEDAYAYKSAQINIQTLVYNCYNHFIDTVLKGKQGLGRTSLLGKNIDFCARAVIVGDPGVPIDCIKVPFESLLTMFKYHTMFMLNKHYKNDLEKIGIRCNRLTISGLLDDIRDKKKVDSNVIQIIRTALERYIKENDSVVIYKRDPVLHRLGLRAAKPIISDSDCVHINPLVTEGFNADFDGDQMGIQLPLTEEAQAEAKKLMTYDNDIIHPSDEFNIVFKNDTLFGLYYLTKGEPDKKLKQFEYPKNVEDHFKLLKDLKFELLTPTRYGKHNTTLGKAIVMDILGLDSPPEKITKKNMNKYFHMIDKKTFPMRMDMLMKIAIIIPTVFGKGVDGLEYELPEDLKKEKDKILTADNPQKMIDDITDEFLKRKEKEDSIVFELIESGARGKSTQIKQSVVSKGYVTSADGETIDKPIVTSLSEGLKPSEYYLSGIGARKGLVDRSQSTANSGYLTRQMVYALSSIQYDSKIKDCKSKDGLRILVADKNHAKGLLGRYLMNGKVIDDADSIVGKVIEIRSPMYCRSESICRTCLGQTVDRFNAHNVGIIAAQMIGEKASQGTMRTFHTGGVGALSYYPDEHPDFRNFFNQKDGVVTSLVKCEFLIENYNINSQSDSEIEISDFIVRVNNKDYTVSLLYPFIIFTKNCKMIYTKTEMTLQFEQNQEVASMRKSSVDVTDAVGLMKKVMGNKRLMHEILYAKLYTSTSLMGSLPSWAVELVASQLQRHPEKDYLPYRLYTGKKDPIRINIKDVSLIEDWVRGAVFENVNKAITKAVLHGEKMKRVSSDLNMLVDL